MKYAKEIKLVAATVMAVLVVVIILQNRQVVETNLIFATVRAPHAVTLFLAVLIGFLLGGFAGRRTLRKRR